MSSLYHECNIGTFRDTYMVDKEYYAQLELGMISSKDKPIRESPTVFYSLDKDVLGQVLTDLESMYVCISINE